MNYVTFGIEKKVIWVPKFEALLNELLKFSDIKLSKFRQNS